MCMRVCMFVCPRAYLRNPTAEFTKFPVHADCGYGSIHFWILAILTNLCTSGLRITSRFHTVGSAMCRVLSQMTNEQYNSRDYGMDSNQILLTTKTTK